jgi:cephalosporin-C deacetylase-like acetyl esterase
MRRLVLAVAALGLFSLPVTADDDLTILKPGPGDVPLSRWLYTYLEGQAKVHFDARRTAIAAIKTMGDVNRRQTELKAKFYEALGELPAEKTPLHPRVTGTLKRDGYTVEKVVYESRPGHHITALLYIPKGTPPFPGVLVPCGHSDNGKAAEAYQRISILLAKNGMAALCYDPIGQGERIQWLDERGKPAVNGGTTEHTLAGLGALLVSRSAAGYRFWDGVRSLDYLASRPEVDPTRLGCTGNSGGGTETAYLMALDDRIAAAAPSCYITSLERLFATIGPQDAEQNITGQVAFGMEHADYVTLRAPKPTLISAGTRDFFDIRGAWDTYQEVKRLYCTIGFGERVDLFESDEPHGFTEPRRQSCMRWMRRWLLGKDDAAVETDFPIDADQDIQCTKTGQVLSEYHDVSVFDLNAERARTLTAYRASLHQAIGPSGLINEIRKVLALPKTAPEVIVDRRKPIHRDGYTIDKWAIQTEPGVEVPLLLFRSDSPGAGKPLVVYIGASRELAAVGGTIEKQVKAGESVALFEPRGMGETAPGGPGAPRSGAFGGDIKEAFLALHLNRPLLGQRVYDVLQAFRALDQKDGFHLIGIGSGGTIALHAAALEPKVARLTLERPIISWTSVASNKSKRGDLADVVPGALRLYDLPELAATLAPRALTIRSPLDPSGKAVTQDEIDKTYILCKKTYDAASADTNLVLQAAP